MIDDRHWMKLAYQNAMLARDLGEVPVGAVLVLDNNILLAESYNRTILDTDPTAHAEIIGIRVAAQKIHNYRLLDTTLYVTLEPCIMCIGAILQARIKRVVFAVRDLKSGAAGSAYTLHNSQYQNHSCTIDEGVMQRECAEILKDFFNNKRK